MKRDFFDELGQTLQRTAKEFGEKAENIYETQKLRNRIAGEEREIRNLKEELGDIIYRIFEEGGVLSDEETELCQKISVHQNIIESVKAEMADKKGQKICPECKKHVDKEAAFCPHCGAACPTPEEDTWEEAEVVEDEFAEEEAPAEEAPAEEEPAEEAPAEETPEEETPAEEVPAEEEDPKEDTEA